jgi:hypothetical protein
VQVTNEGTRAGRAKCQLTARDAAGNELRTRSSISPQVPAGETITFTDRIPGLAAAPDSVGASCG